MSVHYSTAHMKDLASYLNPLYSSCSFLTELVPARSLRLSARADWGLGTEDRL